MIQFNFKTAKTFLTILVSFCLLTAQNSSAQTATWTDIFSTKNANFYDIQKSYEKQEKKWERADRKALRKGEEVREHSGEEVYNRWESYMSPRVYPSGNLSLPSSNYANFIQWQKEHPIVETQKKTRAGNWTLIGPIGTPSGPLPYTRTGAGRVNFIRVSPTDSNTYYIGAPDGGLWKSTNGGTTWTTNTDFLTVIGCSGLAIDPTNTQTMYLATGDLEGNRRSIGILKSIDGGTTWNTTGLSWTPIDNYKASKLVMNPSNPLNMILATDGGSFRTTDGWVTYTTGVFPSGLPNLKDMEMKPGDPNTLYASGNKIFKSIDNGANWTEITTGLPSSNISRIALGVSEGNNAYVYALYGKSSDQSYLGMYRSVNSGASFSLRSSTPNLLGYDFNGLDLTSGQAFYDLSIAVSPTNAEIVTTGGINHWQSTDGGVTWANLSVWDSGEIHADIHEISYLPNSGTTMFSCNDGGIFKSFDNGNNFTDISNNLVISQNVGIGSSATVATTIVNGTQDNGTNLKTGASWTNINGGDGGECFMDPTNNNTIYIQYVSGAFSRSDDGGATNNGITTGLPTGFDFYSTWILDPVNSNKLYVGGIPTLYTSNNKGDIWTPLGTPNGTGTIKAIAVAPSNTSIIYIVKDDAISKSINGGTVFNDITGTLPVGSATPVMLAVSNTDPLKVWVVFSGYSANDKVFKSIDGGITWTNISTGLPNLPINTIVYKNGSANDAIYIGADIGIYYMDNATPWLSYFTDLPNVAVRDLEIFYPTSKLRAGTYGRGVWESPLYVNIPLPVTIKTFTGETQNEINNLHWTTSQEINLLNYDLQRSANGLDYNTIATIKANGTNNEATYNYTDTKPLNGNNYYRLQANDIDNKTSYSNIVDLFISKTEPYIYPNPASDNVTVEMQNTIFSLKMIDINGKVVANKSTINNKTQIDTHTFSNGFYTIEITTNDGILFTQKINITH